MKYPVLGFEMWAFPLDVLEQGIADFGTVGWMNAVQPLRRVLAYAVAGAVMWVVARKTF